MTQASQDSLRSRLQRYFLISFIAVGAVSLGIVFQFTRQARAQEEAFYFTGLTQVLSDLARRSLEISDYSETQRILSYVSHDERIIPAVLTTDGDLLIRDYAQSRAIGMEGKRLGVTCAALSQAHKPSPAGKLFCSDIIGNGDDLGRNSVHLGVSLIFLKERPLIFPLHKFLWIFGSMILSLFSLAWITRRYMELLVVSPLEELRSWVLERTASPFSPVSESSGPGFEVEELSQLKDVFGGLLEAVQKEAHKRQETEKELAVQNLARQVAHDIRSPLAALEVAAEDISRFSEEKRVLIRSAVGRIRDIANNLLEATREGNSSSSAETIEIIAPLIDSVVSEKRTQFSNKAALYIERSYEPEAVTAFSRVDAVTFKRLLSNLINNSIEAMKDHGAVRITLALSGELVELRIADDGPGMPPQVLERLGQRGNTVGKSGGSGLGLHHAKSYVESWGGTLAIGTKEGSGTTVFIRLPRAYAPEWFAPILILTPGHPVVVVDDDPSVHKVWQTRFDSLGLDRNAISVVHLSSPDELRGWVRENPANSGLATYLTDFELLGHQETGLTLIEELKLSQQAILVTSRYEEQDILSECLRLEVHMLPKGLAGFIPIHINQKATIPATVLMDDDALVHMTWKIAAESKGVSLMSFTDPYKFRESAQRLPKDTRIYVDSELGDGQRGEAIAKDLYALGFRNLYLTTGHAAESLPELPWIKKIVDKIPPW